MTIADVSMSIPLRTTAPSGCTTVSTKLGPRGTLRLEPGGLYESVCVLEYIRGRVRTTKKRDTRTE